PRVRRLGGSSRRQGRQARLSAAHRARARRKPTRSRAPRATRGQSRRRRRPDVRRFRLRRRSHGPQARRSMGRRIRPKPSRRGAVRDYGHFRAPFLASRDWKPIEISFDALQQPDWGRPIARAWVDVTSIAFMPDALFNDEDYDLAVDDVVLTK